MLILHSSNRTENLLFHLKTVLSKPLQSPFDTELLLVQSQGMERWLSQQLAESFTVWGNFQFLFPRRFFSDMLARLPIKRLTQQGLLDREALVWQFERLLREVNDNQTFVKLTSYLTGKQRDIKRFQLAQKLAYLFDQYQVMRPEWFDAWDKDKLISDQEDELWQRELWQMLADDQAITGVGQQWKKIIHWLDNKALGSLAHVLPERVSVFGINAMSPLYLGLLSALARHIDVHVYLLNPAQCYWADLASKRQLAQQQKALDPDQLIHYHNPLLVALGQQGKAFQSLILEQVEFEHEYSSFETNDGLSLLKHIQNDVLNNTTSPLKKDILNNGRCPSIAIHSCHSRLREVEVLYDQLRHALETNSDLELREMVVMTPNIQQYAPYIDAIFADIPHALTDRSLRTSNHLVEILLRFLSMVSGSLGLSSVLEVLTEPSVYINFNLTEADLDSIQHWLVHSGIRFGASAEHRQGIGSGCFTENSWKAGFERLFYGYAMGEVEGFVEGQHERILPYPQLEGSNAEPLGGLFFFYQHIQAALEFTKQPHLLNEWADWLRQECQTLFASDEILKQVGIEEKNNRYSLLLLLDKLDDYATTHTSPVTLEVVEYWLEQSSEEERNVTGFMRGQLTFCSMMPMRAIPFKVIALLGMNEGDYPNQDDYLAFDLMEDDYRPGDRSRRADERYQFLEILLSARDRLLMSYVGQSIRTNESIPPSVVIAEMLDLCETHYHVLPQQLITTHPLQAFSPLYFKSGSLFSYSHNNLLLAQRMQAVSQQRDENKMWADSLIIAPSAESNVNQSSHSTIIPINELLDYFRNPQQYFARHVLGIYLRAVEEDIQDHEMFNLSKMAQMQVDQAWVDLVLANQDNDDERLLVNEKTYFQRLNAEAKWYQEPLSSIEFNRKKDAIYHFVDAVNHHHLDIPIDDLSIDFTTDSYRLLGALPHCFKAANGYYRYAKITGADVMKGWLHHLIYHLSMQGNGPHTPVWKPRETYVIGNEGDTKNVCFRMPEKDELGQLEIALVGLIDSYREGQISPSYFFVKPAYHWLKQAMSTRGTKHPLDVAEEEWLRQIDYDLFWQLLYRDVNMLLLMKKFEQVCEPIMLNMKGFLK